jgi:UDP-perosamine 4-acetyltransferase
VSAIVIVGTGDHARVVAELVHAAGLELAGFVEPDRARATTAEPPGRLLVGLDGDADWLDELAGSEVVVAVGANDVRGRLFGTCRALGLVPRAVIHPSATLLGGATVDDGAQVCARALLGVDARIGVNAIVNTMASLDHDVVVGEHAFIGPGALLAGRVSVGRAAHVGLAAVVREGAKIGAGALVAAGAVVVGDVPAGARVAGVPARPMDQ